MITIETEIFVERIGGREIFDFLLGATDDEYRRWWLGTHPRLHALERHEGHAGDVSCMDEYVGGRCVRIKGVVVEAERGRRGAGPLLQYGLTPLGLAASMAFGAPLLTGSPLDVPTAIVLLFFGVVCFALLAFFGRDAKAVGRETSGARGLAATEAIREEQSHGSARRQDSVREAPTRG